MCASKARDGTSSLELGPASHGPQLWRRRTCVEHFARSVSSYDTLLAADATCVSSLQHATISISLLRAILGNATVACHAKCCVTVFCIGHPYPYWESGQNPVRPILGTIRVGTRTSPTRHTTKMYSKFETTRDATNKYSKQSSHSISSLSLSPQRRGKKKKLKKEINIATAKAAPHWNPELEAGDTRPVPEARLFMTTKHLRHPDVKVRGRESPTEGRYHHGRRQDPHPPTGAYKQKRDEKKTQTRRSSRN